MTYRSLSEHLRWAAETFRGPDKTEYHPEQIKIYFDAPKPEKPGSETLDIKKEKFEESNFQWVSYNLLFTYKEGDEEPDYFVYQVGLSSNGDEKENSLIFDSDSDFSLEHAKKPSEILKPGDVKRSMARILKGPDLFPSKDYQTIYINTNESEKGRKYSSDKFKEFFNNDFYIVLNPKSQELKNPYGKLLGKKYS